MFFWGQFALPQVSILVFGISFGVSFDASFKTSFAAELITWDEFRDYIKKEDSMTRLLTQGINVWEASDIFRMLDEIDGAYDGRVDLESTDRRQMAESLFARRCAWKRLDYSGLDLCKTAAIDARP